MLPLVIAKLKLVYFAAASSCSHSFFFFPDWWEYLNPQPVPPVCSINMTFPGDLWLIGLAILDILLRLAGFIAVISIIIAGFELIRSEGNSEKATNARQRLVNSLVGLAIAAGATALVTFVGNTVGGANGGLPQVEANQTALNNILNAIFVILGSLAVLFIILAGLRMITSGDNPTKVSEARRQIIYASIGLIVIAMAGTIVDFILNKLA
jgi:type IV secretory pathway VirB2 component (pilin)